MKVYIFWECTCRCSLSNSKLFVSAKNCQRQPKIIEIILAIIWNTPAIKIANVNLGHNTKMVNYVSNSTWCALRYQPPSSPLKNNPSPFFCQASPPLPKSANCPYLPLSGNPPSIYMLVFNHCFPQQIRPQITVTVQLYILRDYSSVIIGFNMISKHHTLLDTAC